MYGPEQKRFPVDSLAVIDGYKNRLENGDSKDGFLIGLKAEYSQTGEAKVIEVYKAQKVRILFPSGESLPGIISSASSGSTHRGEAGFYVQCLLGVVPPPPKEMTLDEIEKVLGHKVKIVGG